MPPDAGPPDPGIATRIVSVGTLARTMLLTLVFVTFAFVLYLVIGTALEHHAAESGRFADFRGKLAQGIAPVSPVDDKGHVLRLGTPIAVVRIPTLGLREVVGEGTTSGVLESGPGHLRSTVFPGGAGTSVIFGRSGVVRRTVPVDLAPAAWDTRRSDHRRRDLGLSCRRCSACR